jgi:hypothetical protein
MIDMKRRAAALHAADLLTCSVRFYDALLRRSAALKQRDHAHARPTSFRHDKLTRMTDPHCLLSFLSWGKARNPRWELALPLRSMFSRGPVSNHTGGLTAQRRQSFENPARGRAVRELGTMNHTERKVPFVVAPSRGADPR